MNEFAKTIQTDDYKMEKHVPVIDAPESVSKGKIFKVNVSVGKEVEHPNTTQHHIRWISLFFLPDGEKNPIQIGDIIFAAHGSSTSGADTSTVYTNHSGTLEFKTEKSGTLLAASYCNIHGLWESSKKLDVK
jgi:superoxide reductase